VPPITEIDAELATIECLLKDGAERAGSAVSRRFAQKRLADLRTLLIKQVRGCVQHDTVTHMEPVVSFIEKAISYPPDAKDLVGLSRRYCQRLNGR
jgi:hypothetical protein